MFFASHGVDAFGLEISASAIKAASEYAAPALAGAPEGFGKVRFEQGDFYKDEWVVEMGADLEGGFDYVYDYTVG